MNVGESPSDNSQGYQHFLLCKSKFNIDKCTRGGILSFLLLPLPPCLHLAGPPPLLTGRRTIDLGGPQAGPPSLSPLNQNRSFSFASRCRIRDSAFCKRRCMGKRIDGFGAACEWRGFFLSFSSSCVRCPYFYLCLIYSGSTFPRAADGILCCPVVVLFHEGRADAPLSIIESLPRRWGRHSRVRAVHVRQARNLQVQVET